MNQLTEYYNTEDKIKKLTKEMHELVLMKNRDPEKTHDRADDILCEVLMELGYKELVEEYLEVEKFYS